MSAGRLWGEAGAYGAWSDHLRRWSAGENPPDDGLPHLAEQDFPQDTWARLVDRICTAVNTRLNAWVTAGQRALDDAARSGDVFSFGRALTQARTGLRTVRRLTAHPGLPEALRTRLTDMVDERVRDLQRTLEADVARAAAANRDPSSEQVLRAVRDNPLTAVLDEEPPAAGPGEPRAGQAPATTGPDAARQDTAWQNATGTPARRRLFRD